MDILQSYIGHIINVMPSLLQGAVITVEVTSLSVFFGTIIGIFMALGKLSKSKIFHYPSVVYIDFIRGTPLLVQILLFYYGIPGLISNVTGEPLRIDPILAGVVVCSINSGAYVAEIVRAGIQSIEKGQMEAARSLGMSHAQTMKDIILPQAFRRIMPPLGNEFIVLLKDSSLLAVIGVPELLKSGQLYVATTFASFPVYIGVALVYLVMTLTISRLVHYSERRLGVGND
ncbi:amino acid ABC transporter permease [Methanococcoides methylutens]|uniref:Glutamate transport membrane-spanning protein n=1 Tax=Methanococcoides methylutens MM1 TaxID=1434104 RepID=A0A0E3WZL6_METMT|nr:amino acid ABC transporter permease [Methanococcoides methylutens]AKB85164.1 Glutamate transport membrane-spanning protein [Methanococcoides methylutens MM1]